jgi:hypothetical protein
VPRVHSRGQLARLQEPSATAPISGRALRSPSI